MFCFGYLSRLCIRNSSIDLIAKYLINPIVDSLIYKAKLLANPFDSLNANLNAVVGQVGLPRTFSVCHKKYDYTSCRSTAG